MNETTVLTTLAERAFPLTLLVLQEIEKTKQTNNQTNQKKKSMRELSECMFRGVNYLRLWESVMNRLKDKIFHKLAN